MHETLGIGKIDTSSNRKRKKKEGVINLIIIFILYRVFLIQLNSGMKSGNDYLEKMQMQKISKMLWKNYKNQKIWRKKQN